MNALKTSLLSALMVTGALQADPIEVKATRVIEEKTDINVLGKQFDKLSDDYVAGRKGYSDEIYNLLTKKAKEAFPDLSTEQLAILDAGTGTGIAIREMRGKGFSNLKGTDISENQLAAAQKADPDYASDYFVAPTEKIPFEDKSFEIVTAFAAFHWFNNEESINEISRVLKDGGFFFAVNQSKGAHELRDGADQIIRDLGFSFEHPRHTFDAADSLKAHGFTVVEESIPSTKVYTSVSEVVTQLKSRSTWGLVKGTDKEEEAERRLEELVKKVFEKSGDGTYTSTALRNCVIAYKPYAN